MSAAIHLTTPVPPSFQQQSSGISPLDEVFLSGNRIFTLRDASAKKIATAKKIPVDLTNSAIYFCAPSYILQESSARRNGVNRRHLDNNYLVGSCGPTTSARMADYVPFLISKGVKIFIGKGPLPDETLKILEKNKCLYLLSIGGCGAYYNQYITGCHIAAYPELGPEAILELSVREMPLIAGSNHTKKKGKRYN